MQTFRSRLTETPPFEGSRCHARHGHLLPAVVAGLAVLSLWAGALSSEDVCRLLGEKNVPFDSNAVHRAAVAAVLTAVDPRSLLLSPEDAQALTVGQTVQQAETWAEGIAYMKLGGMYEGGASNVMHRLLQWTNESLAGLIVDVRGAGGVNLWTVDEISGLLLADDDVPLYTIRGGNGAIVEERRAQSATLPGQRPPVMLLVDDNTRDASEVLCAALKKQSGVMLIGAPTLGDNGVRELIPLASNMVCYVATRWVHLLDTNDSYRGTGVLPDIPVSGTDENHTVTVRPENGSIMKPLSDKARTDRELMLRVAGDPVLMRATDILLGLKALRPTVSPPDSTAGEQPPL